LQVALTSLGFDTRGNDGAFGPRSRDMITAWQKARKLPETGFLDAAQQQALLKEGAAAVTKYDDEQKKIEDDKKKAEEEAKKKADEDAKKKADEEAKAKAAGAAPAASAPPQGGFDGQWGGQVGPWAVGLVVNGSKGTLRIECGAAASFEVAVG